MACVCNFMLSVLMRSSYVYYLMHMAVTKYVNKCVTNYLVLRDIFCRTDLCEEKHALCIFVLMICHWCNYFVSALEQRSFDTIVCHLCLIQICTHRGVSLTQWLPYREDGTAISLATVL